MGLIEIIMLGYLTNIAALVVIFVVTFVHAMMNMANPDFVKKFTIVEDVGHYIKRAKNKLKEKNMPTRVQTDYIIFVPFSGVLTLLIFTWKAATVGILEYLFLELESKLAKLEQRLDSRI